jgi:hypothetical protein
LGPSLRGFTVTVMKNMKNALFVSEIIPFVVNV